MTTSNNARPGGVTTVAVLTWISGAISVITGLLLLFQTGNADIVARFGEAALLVVFAVSVMIVGIVVLIVAGGLLRGINGARVVAVIFQALSIAAAIWLSISAPAFLWAAVIGIVVSVAVIVLLFSGRANAYFRD
ncbi:hypothetical protein [Leifsonia sp. NPDC058230]|uniref:DUF7144 family membrane protein n=1 Tax=Leifsonia sp. NPDC058230 TaxID=3346391 RepID=UPI0036D822F5